MISTPRSAPKIIRPVEGSVEEDGIFCLFDNVKRHMMSRYVFAKYGMTEDQYKAYCGLPADYPMTAFRHIAGRETPTER